MAHTTVIIHSIGVGLAGDGRVAHPSSRVGASGQAAASAVPRAASICAGGRCTRYAQLGWGYDDVGRLLGGLGRGLVRGASHGEIEDRQRASFYERMHPNLARYIYHSMHAV